MPTPPAIITASATSSAADWLPQAEGLSSSKRRFVSSRKRSSLSSTRAIASGGNNSAIVYIAQDDISFSPVGVAAFLGTVMSYGNNRFAEVPTIGPMGSIALQ